MVGDQHCLLKYVDADFSNSPVCQLTFHIFEEIRLEEAEVPPSGPQSSLSTAEFSGIKKDATEKSQRTTTESKSNNKPK